MNNISGKNVIIYGADTGLGRSLAVAMGKERAHLALIGGNRKDLEDVERDAGVYRTRVYGYTCDAGSGKDVERTVKSILGHFDTIDIFIFISSPFENVPYTQCSGDAIFKEIQRRIAGPILLMRHFVKEMGAKNRGSVLVAVDDTAVRGRNAHALAGAASSGMKGFADSLRAELKSRGASKVHVATAVIGGSGMNGGSGAAEKILEALQNGKSAIMYPAAAGILSRFRK
ncbi:MAG TPA: SDR family oxidoreductase [Spirochaetota bacterium]|nr:SDR family oxidoreductase [Spirochaetota bacterium]